MVSTHIIVQAILQTYLNGKCLIKMYYNPESTTQRLDTIISIAMFG